MNPLFKGKTLIVGFEGWNDAGDAASTAARFIAEACDAELVASLEAEEYYDFQLNRPIVTLNEDGDRTLNWPTTELWVTSKDSKVPGSERLGFLLGVEPNVRWKSFVAEIVELVLDREYDAVLFLGGILADVPHSRPIGVRSTSPNRLMQAAYSVEASSYQGAVGILSALSVELEKAGVPTLSVWASVPAYVHSGPSPKAALALVAEIERYTLIQVDHGTLPDEAFKWERSIDEMAEGDEDMTGYIQQLEETSDANGLENTSGDALALEFERYLRQTENGDD